MFASEVNTPPNALTEASGRGAFAQPSPKIKRVTGILPAKSHISLASKTVILNPLRSSSLNFSEDLPHSSNIYAISVTLVVSNLSPRSNVKTLLFFPQH